MPHFQGNRGGRYTITYDEIMSMQPGREMDAIVAEKVMHGKLESIKTLAPEPMYYWNFSETHQPWAKDWKPSIDILSAWDVVTKLSKRYIIGVNGDEDEWSCDITPRFQEDEEHMGLIRSHAKTAPEAICKAALLLLIA
jgi:hypothetical protein